MFWIKTKLAALFGCCSTQNKQTGAVFKRPVEKPTEKSSKNMKKDPPGTKGDNSQSTRHQANRITEVSWIPNSIESGRESWAGMFQRRRGPTEHGIVYGPAKYICLLGTITSISVDCRHVKSYRGDVREECDVTDVTCTTRVRCVPVNSRMSDSRVPSKDNWCCSTPITAERRTFAGEGLRQQNDDSVMVTCGSWTTRDGDNVMTSQYTSEYVT